MPLTSPVRRDFISGQLGSSLASSATAITFGAVPAFPTISGGDSYAALALIDPANLTNSEIVYLSSYTAGATTGGILRAQETVYGGGSANSFASNASWDHAPVVSDFAHPNIAVGASTVVDGVVVISGGNNVTAGIAGSTITLSADFPADPINIAGNTSNTTANLTAGSLFFVGGNNVTAAMTTGAGVNSIGFNVAAPPTISANGVFVSITNTSNSTLGPLFVYASYLTRDGNSVTFGVPSLYALSVGVQTAAGGTSAGSILTQGVNRGDFFYFGSNLSLSGSTSVGPVFDQTQSLTINALVPVPGISTQGNTAGTTGFLTGKGSYQFVGTNGVSLSQATDSNGYTLSINAPAAPAYPFFEPMPILQSGSTVFAPGNASWYFQPVMVEGVIGSGRLNVLHSFGSTSSQLLQASSITRFDSVTTGGASQTFVWQKTVGMYSRGTGTNATRIESSWSNTFSINVSQSIGVSLTNASQLTVQHQLAIVYPVQVGTNGAYTMSTLSATHNESYANSSTVTQAVTTNAGIASIYNILSGGILMPFGFNTTIGAGNAWLGQAWRNNQTTAGSSLPIAIPAASQVGLYGVSSYSMRPFGLTAASSGSQYMPGLGVWSVASTAIPTNVAFTEIRSFASNVIPYFNVLASSLS